ncbi:unnamed protein product [Somion occarium]|uniref:Uncharacterized protein n=1 Tax=Somion occarium TaxID=3059160 RepID=A0ABP1DM15_9APHY
MSWGELGSGIQAVPGNSLHTAYERALTGGVFIDTVFYVYSRKKSSGGVYAPRPIFASSAMLKPASSYFNSLLGGRFQEGQVGNIDAGFPEDKPTSMDEYDYDSDSDLELDDDDAPQALDVVHDDIDVAADASGNWETMYHIESAPVRIVVSEQDVVVSESTTHTTVSIFNLVPLSRRLSVCLSIDCVCQAPTTSPAPQASTNETVQPSPTIQHDTIVTARMGRIVLIRDFAYTTWLALLYYLGTKELVFAPLRSKGERGQRAPRRCSPKSMYRLAHMLDLNDVKTLAIQNLRSQLQTKIIFPELFSSVTTTYPEITQALVDYFMQYHNSNDVIQAAPTWIDKVASGELANCSSTFKALVIRLLSVPPSAQRGYRY